MVHSNNLAPTVRRCLEKQHDALMIETNGRYWQTLGAGS